MAANNFDPLVATVAAKALIQARQAIARAMTPGPRGFAGQDGKNGAPGKDGKDGAKGDTPDHEWIGTGLRFEKPDGTWGETVDLRGKKGASGGRGGGGSNAPAPFDLAALPLASNDLPTEFVIKQGDSWVKATYEQMRAWFPYGALPDGTMTVNGEPVTVDGAFVTVSP